MNGKIPSDNRPCVHLTRLHKMILKIFPLMNESPLFKAAFKISFRLKHFHV